MKNCLIIFLFLFLFIFSINFIEDVDARTMKKAIFAEPIKQEIIDKKEFSEKGWGFSIILGMVGIGIAVAALFISRSSAKEDKEDLKKFVKGQRILQVGITALVTKNFKAARRYFDEYLKTEIDSGALINAGNASFYMKKYDDAFESYEGAVTIDPDNSHAIHNMGVCLIEFEDYELAILFFMEAIQIDNSYQDAFSNLGSCLINTGKISEAFTVLNNAIRMDDRDPIPHVYKSQAYSSQQNYEKALESINSALKLDPVNIDALNQKGQILYTANNHKESVIYYNRVLKLDSVNKSATYNKILSLLKLEKFEEAEPLIDRFIIFEPENPEIFVYKGQCLHMLKKADESIYHLKKALKHANPAVNKSFTVNILSNLGAAYAGKDDFQKSLKYFNKALQIEYNSSEILSRKGICLARLGRLEKAISIGVDESLRVKPDNLFALKMKAEFLSKCGEHSKTLMVCDQILQLTNNQDEEILRLKADELSSNEKYEEAICTYDKFLELNPDHVHVLSKKAHILAIIDKKDEAVTVYNNILQKRPYDIRILISKGAILYREHLYERAIITCYDVVLNMCSANATAWAGK